MIGHAKSGRIIISVASIIVLVFGWFLFDQDLILKEFSFGLGFSSLTRS